MRVPIFVQDCGIVTPLGVGKKEVIQALCAGDKTGMVTRHDLIADSDVYVGAVTHNLPAVPPALAEYDCRNNRMMQSCLEQIQPSVEKAVRKYGRHRIAAILGTSTSGISNAETALLYQKQNGHWPEGFHYHQQETSSLSRFSSLFLGLTGPSYTIATACSSSAKVFASAQRLIRAGVVDAAIVGGTDTLCRTTLNGFGSLGLLSKSQCNPFSKNRDGITIGEGAAAFLLTRDDGPVTLMGTGESSDAYHTTAPDPEGNGAKIAIRQALAEAELSPDSISYINLHGTATELNDAMESRVVSDIFGSTVSCSSTKGMTGHMLGAAGGCEAAFLWLMLNPETSTKALPPHLWDGQADDKLPALNFVTHNTSMSNAEKVAMLSNSFGFGGSNVALILGRGFV